MYNKKNEKKNKKQATKEDNFKVEKDSIKFIDSNWILWNPSNSLNCIFHKILISV